MTDRAENTKMIQTRTSARLRSREGNLEMCTEPTPMHALTHHHRSAQDDSRGRMVPMEVAGNGFPSAGGRRLYGVGSPLLCSQECVRLSQAYREPERKAIQIVVCPQQEHRLHSQTRINCGLPLRSPASPAESAGPSSFLLSSFISLHSALHLRLKKHYGAFTCVLAYTIIFAWTFTLQPQPLICFLGLLKSTPP